MKIPSVRYCTLLCKFYIFDFCGNFEFFRMSKGKPTANMIALQGAIFNL